MRRSAYQTRSPGCTHFATAFARGLVARGCNSGDLLAAPEIGHYRRGQPSRRSDLAPSGATSFEASEETLGHAGQRHRDHRADGKTLAPKPRLWVELWRDAPYTAVTHRGRCAGLRLRQRVTPNRLRTRRGRTAKLPGSAPSGEVVMHKTLSAIAVARGLVAVRHSLEKHRDVGAHRHTYASTTMSKYARIDRRARQPR